MTTPPVKFDRGALERVLARAAELQAAQQAGDTGEGLTEQQLVELGREVGLDAVALRQAMAEEQSKAIAPRDASIATRLLGAASVSAERTVPGTPAEVLAALDEWMRRHEYLQLKRRHPSRLVWEPQRDVAASMARTVERMFGGKEHAFSRAVEVSAFVAAVDASHVHVRLDADLSPLRSGYAGGGVALGLVGAAVAGVLVALGAFPVVAAAPAVVGPVVGLIVARSFRGPVARAGLALDQLLDRLESGELKRRGSLLEALKQATLPPGFGGR
jgi:hypothetical protein